MKNLLWRSENRADVTEGASGDGFEGTTRIQTNILARAERRLLTWACGKTPEWVSPDHYTALGFVGAGVAFAGYALSSWRIDFLLLAVVGLALNWVGDSLDGSLARFRRVERPKYGYFLDHSFDVINISLILVGVGLTPYVRLDAALFALLGCLLVTIHVLLANHVEGRFHIGFAGFGPTELRIVFAVFALDMCFIGPRYFTLLGWRVSNDTLFTLLLGVIFAGMFIHDTYKLERRLAGSDRRPEPGG